MSFDLTITLGNVLTALLAMASFAGAAWKVHTDRVKRDAQLDKDLSDLRRDLKNDLQFLKSEKDREVENLKRDVSELRDDQHLADAHLAEQVVERRQHRARLTGAGLKR